MKINLAISISTNRDTYEKLMRFSPDDIPLQQMTLMEFYLHLLCNTKEEAGLR